MSAAAASARPSAAVATSLAISLAISLAVSLGAPTAAIGSTASYRPFIVSPDAPQAPAFPEHVVADPLGPVYVADTGNDRVAVYNRDGSLLRTIGGPGAGVGALSSPVAVAIDSSSVYVADRGNARIAVFALDGDYSRSISVTAPKSLAVGNERIFVTAAGVDGVLVFPRLGGAGVTWGVSGNVSGAFSSPSGLAFDGALYIADTGNKRVQVLDGSTGAYLGQWGPETVGGITVSRYVAPVGVGLGTPAGVLVSDSNGQWVQQVQRVNPYAQISQWGTKGVYDGTLKSPQASTIASDGTAWIADPGLNRIARHKGAWLEPLSVHSSAEGRFSRPGGLAVDASGTVFVGDVDNKRVERYDANGAREFTAVTGISASGPVAVAPNGDLVVSHLSGSIYRYSAAGLLLGTFGGGQLLNPGGMDVAPNGTVFVADAGNHRVAVYGTDGTLLRSLSVAGFSNPKDVAYDSADDVLWVADTGNHRVVKIAASDGAVRLILPTGGLPGSGDGQFLSPEGVEVDSGGNVVVADTGNNRVQRFARGGQHLETIGQRGNLPGRFHAPVDVAFFGPGDRMWVLERDGARLQALTRDDEAPSVSAMGVPPSAVNHDVDVTLAATDTISGVASVWWRINGGAPQTYAGPVRIASEGTTTVGWWAVDRVGNVSAEQTAAVVIDRTPPSGSFLVAGGAYWNPASPAAIVSEVSDAVQMRVGIGSELSDWSEYAPSTSIELPGSDGKYSVAAEYRDQLGNVLRLVQQVGIDRTGPSAPVPSSSTHATGVIVRSAGSAQFAWSEPADLSGADAYSYVLDRAQATTPSAFARTSARLVSLPISGSGTWYFHVRARDVAGNWGAVSHYTLMQSGRSTLSTPVATVGEATEAGRRVSVAGTLTPAHEPCDVRVWALRREGRAWTPVASQSATLSPSGASLGFSAEFDLAPGYYRFSAVHAAHAPYERARSAYSRAVRVR